MTFTNVFRLRLFATEIHDVSAHYSSFFEGAHFTKSQLRIPFRHTWIELLEPFRQRQFDVATITRQYQVGISTRF